MVVSQGPGTPFLRYFYGFIVPTGLKISLRETEPFHSISFRKSPNVVNRDKWRVLVTERPDT